MLRSDPLDQPHDDNIHMPKLRLFQPQSLLLSNIRICTVPADNSLLLPGGIKLLHVQYFLLNQWHFHSCKQDYTLLLDTLDKQHAHKAHSLFLYPFQLHCRFHSNTLNYIMPVHNPDCWQPHTIRWQHPCSVRCLPQIHNSTPH